RWVWALPAGSAADRDRAAAVVVDAPPVESRDVVPQTGQSRPVIARLGVGRDRSDLDMAEPQVRQGTDADSVLVEAGGQSDPVGKRQTERLDRADCPGAADEAQQSSQQRNRVEPSQGRQREVVGDRKSAV